MKSYSEWMDHMIKSAVLAILFIVLCVLPSRSSEYAVTPITPAGGLPQADVKSVEFDRDGLMWVVTYEGVARFDGYEFENFPLYANGNLSTQIRIAKCDNDGNIWIITMDQGLFVYDTSNEQIVHLSSELEDYYDLQTTLYDV